MSNITFTINEGATLNYKFRFMKQSNCIIDTAIKTLDTQLSQRYSTNYSMQAMQLLGRMKAKRIGHIDFVTNRSFLQVICGLILCSGVGIVAHN